MLIKNAKIYTMEQGVIENGYIITRGSIIHDIGPMETMPQGDFGYMIDGNGKVIMPGLVDGHSHLGMWEDGIGFEGADGNEDTDPITPHLSALDSINPLDPAFSESLSAGVTTAIVGPGSANVLGGQLIAIKTDGMCIDDMIIKNPVSAKAAFGENPKTTYHEKNQTPVTRMAAVALLRENLQKAQQYRQDLKKHNEHPDDNDKPEYNNKLEALLPVLNRQIPLQAHAHRADDICSALRIAKEFDINLILVHCTEGHLVLSKIKQSGFPVMLGPALNDRSKPELKNLTLHTAVEMQCAGIDVAIISDHPETPAKFLLLCAMLHIKDGLDAETALSAITITPACMCGIADRVGSLKKGKDADFIILDGEPLDFYSKIKTVIVNGRICYEGI